MFGLINKLKTGFDIEVGIVHTKMDLGIFAYKSNSLPILVLHPIDRSCCDTWNIPVIP